MDYLTTPSHSTKDYAAIKENPESLFLLLNKYVKVQLIKNCAFEGFIQAIDPITNSIILLTPNKDAYQTALIPGYAVQDVLEIEPTTDIKPPSNKNSIVTSELDITERKKKMMAWLKLNFLPVSEAEDKIMFGSASLLPPYTVNDICTNNPMVVMEVRKIIEKMPEDSHLND